MKLGKHNTRIQFFVFGIQRLEILGPNAAGFLYKMATIGGIGDEIRDMRF